jgi:hypothetical protein
MSGTRFLRWVGWVSRCVNERHCLRAAQQLAIPERVTLSHPNMPIRRWNPARCAIQHYHRLITLRALPALVFGRALSSSWEVPDHPACCPMYSPRAASSFPVVVRPLSMPGREAMLEAAERNVACLERRREAF